MSQGFDNLDFNNIYRNWLQGQIETANARGLMGGQTPTQIINQDLVRPIDRIINQAKSDMVKPNRGIMVGNQGLVRKGPTSISSPKQLPSVYGPNFQLGQEGVLKSGGPTSSSINKQLPTVTKSGAISKTLTKGMLDPVSSTLMLLDAWFGEKNGIKGPGRKVLEQTPWGNLIYGNKSTLTPEMIAGMQSTKSFLNKLGSNNGKPSGSSGSSGGSTSMGRKGARGMSGQPTTQAQVLALAQQLGSNPPIANQQEADTQRANIDAINDYISKLQDVNQPYIDALQNYSNNYDDLVRRNFNAQRYFTAMAGLSGNQGYTRLADALNPINNEANKLNTLKLLRDAQAGDINAINEVMGNLAMAQEMGLPPEAAFANKNLLTMMAARDREANRYQIALENNLMKKYGIDRNYARALAVQGMRGQNALDVASMYTGAYGNSGGVAPGLNQRGTASNVPANYDTMLQSAHNKNNR